MAPRTSEKKLNIIKVPLGRPQIDIKPNFKPNDMLYLEYLENKLKVKPELRNVNYVSKMTNHVIREVRQGDEKGIKFEGEDEKENVWDLTDKKDEQNDRGKEKEDLYEKRYREMREREQRDYDRDKERVREEERTRDRDRDERRGDEHRDRDERRSRRSHHRSRHHRSRRHRHHDESDDELDKMLNKYDDKEKRRERSDREDDDRSEKRGEERSERRSEKRDERQQDEHDERSEKRDDRRSEDDRSDERQREREHQEEHQDERRGEREREPVNVIPSLTEIEKGEIKTVNVDGNNIRDISHITQNEEIENSKKRELLFRFEILKKSYPTHPLPSNLEYMSVKEMQERYDDTIRRVALDSTVESYKQYLYYGCLATEYILGGWFGLEIDGFAREQLVNMNKYERLLVELGEKNYLSGPSSWPVEVRLLGVVLFQAAVFVGTRILAKRAGKMFQNATTPINVKAETPKPKMKGPDLSDIKKNN